MNILVIGGSGLIGSKVVDRLRDRGHRVVAASPSSGVNAVTGEGLDEAMAGVALVIDLANSPSFEDKAVLDFFESAGRHIAAAERKAGVRHHVALSVVGTDRLAASGYFRGKIAQEKLIREAGVPYTIVHSTQFFEFLNGIVQGSDNGQGITLSPARIQPIASDDVADAVVEAALAPPVNGVIEIAGPEALPLSDLVRRYLTAIEDPREVIADAKALYFGAELADDTLLPGPGARRGSIDFDAWINRPR